MARFGIPCRHRRRLPALDLRAIGIVPGVRRVTESLPACPRLRARYAPTVSESRLRRPAYPGWAIVAAALLGGGCGEVERAMGYRTAPVERRDLTATVEATGTVRIRGETAVLPAVEGRLISIAVAAGDRVRQGQVLATLDSTTLLHDLEGARASAAAAGAAVEEAEITRRTASEEHERLKRMKSKGQVSAIRLGEAKAAAERAEAALRIAKARRQQARATAAKASWAVRQTELTAPEGGIVLSAPSRTGENVSPRGPPLFLLGQPLEAVRVEAMVGEAEVGRIAAGQRCVVEVEAFPGRSFEGQIERVGVSAVTGRESAPRFRVDLLIENPGRQLLPGMTAAVRFEVATAASVLVVREAAVRFEPPDQTPAPPRSRVFVAVSSGLVPVQVKVGLQEEGYVEVAPKDKGSLKPGDEVVIGLGSGPSKRGAPGLSIGGK